MKKLLVLIILILVLIESLVYLRGKPINLRLGMTLNTYAQEVLAKCSVKDFHDTCYEEEVPKLLGKLKMEDVFKVVQIIQDKDPSYIYCHVLAHKISFAESQRDPSKWKDILSRCPDAQCNYGCLHGSLIQRFRNEVLNDSQIDEVMSDLRDICEARIKFDPSPIDRTMCYHGMGHLAMYMTGGKPDKASKICERISVKPDGKNFTKTCVEGNFMSVFQGVDPEDIALVKDIKPEKDGIDSFCDSYGKYREACHRESYPSFRDEIKTPEGLIKFCLYAKTETDETDCYLAVLNTVTTDLFTKPDAMDKLKLYCDKIPVKRQGICFAGAAERLVQIEPLRYIKKADQVCQMAKNKNQKAEEECYTGLLYYSSFSFKVGSKEFDQYCKNLTKPWDEKCLKP